MNMMTIWGMLDCFIMPWSYANEIPNMLAISQIVILLQFLSTSSITWSTFSSILLFDVRTNHLAPSWRSRCLCKSTHNLCSSLYLLWKASTLNILELSVVSFPSFSKLLCRCTAIVSLCQNHKCNTHFYLTRRYLQACLLLTCSKQEMTQ